MNTEDLLDGLGTNDEGILDDEDDRPPTRSQRRSERVDYKQ